MVINKTNIISKDVMIFSLLENTARKPTKKKKKKNTGDQFILKQNGEWLKQIKNQLKITITIKNAGKSNYCRCFQN